MVVSDVHPVKETPVRALYKLLNAFSDSEVSVVDMQIVPEPQALDGELFDMQPEVVQEELLGAYVVGEDVGFTVGEYVGL